MTKGITSWQEDPDRFDRTKNSDSYLAFGIGGAIMTLGFMT